MNLFNKVSLRVRLTIFMMITLIVACALLTAFSVFSSRAIYTVSVKPEPETGSYNGAETNISEPSRVWQNKTFATIGLIGMVFVIFLGTGAAYLISGKALRPVTDLSRDIENIDENSLFIQVKETNINDEVSRLSSSFNHMIGKLEKVFAAQKNFSANAAHELKTPLTAMIANIEVCQLADNPSQQEYRETLEDVLKNAERLSALVNDLLKMNMDGAMMSYEKIDVKKMFEEIIAELSQEKNENIQIDNHVGDIILFGDKSLLNRAFSNLIHNGIKYNKPNGTIEISAIETDGIVVVSITDTGIGISSEQIDKIFDPFYCVDKSRSRELGGSGLGLSIVKSIVDKHGGKIDVRSVLHKSTTVTVKLPK